LGQRKRLGVITIPIDVDVSEHLFRRESGRLVSALTRIFGVHNLALAEDVVQDAFCRALEVWKVRGVPDNPSGWLMAVARNRALDIVRRQRTARTFAPELTRVLESEWTLASTVEEAFATATIRDEQLRMMLLRGGLGMFDRRNLEVQVGDTVLIINEWGASIKEGIVCEVREEEEVLYYTNPKTGRPNKAKKLCIYKVPPRP